MVDIAVIRTMLTAPRIAVMPSTLDAENHLAVLTPPEFWLDVTLVTTRCSDSNTPSADSDSYSTLTATNSTTKATRETTKLNFVTDQGSTRATVRCACLAGRWDDPFGVAGRGGAGAGVGGLVGIVVAGRIGGAGIGGGGPAVGGDPVERRKVRAGDDGEVGGGSGISQLNAAADTAGMVSGGVDCSADTGRNAALSIGRLNGSAAGYAGVEPSAAGSRAPAAGQSPAAGATGADTGRSKLNAIGWSASTAADGSSKFVDSLSREKAGFGWLPRG